MPVKITCPHCGVKNALTEPLPLPGSQIICVDCTAKLAISYPPGVMDALKARGKSFQDHISGHTPPRPKRRSATPSGSGWLGFMPSASEPDPGPEPLTPAEEKALDEARYQAKQEAERAATGARRLLTSLDTARRMATGLSAPDIQSRIDTLLGWVDESGRAKVAAEEASMRAHDADTPDEGQAAASDAHGHYNIVATLERRLTDHMAGLRTAVKSAKAQADSEQGQAEAARLRAEREQAEAREHAEREQRRQQAARQEEEERQRAAQQEEERKRAVQQEEERQRAAQQEEERKRAARQREQAETERRDALRREQEQLEAERRELERLKAERVEQERRDAERRELERQEAERREQERQQAERLRAEQAEAERVERERIEAQQREEERRQAEQREAERLEQARAEAARLEAMRIEAERVQAAQVEAARLVDAGRQSVASATSSAQALIERSEQTGVDSPSVALAVEQARHAADEAEAARTSLNETASEDSAAALEAWVARLRIAATRARAAADRADAAARTGTVAIDGAIAARDREEAQRLAAVDAAGEAAFELEQLARDVEEQVRSGRELSGDADGPLVRTALGQLVRAGTRVSQSRDRAQEAMLRVRDAQTAPDARLAAEDVRREAYGAQTAAELVEAAVAALQEAVQTAAQAEQAQAELIRDRVERTAQRARSAADATAASAARLADIAARIPQHDPDWQTVQQSATQATTAAEDAATAASRATQAQDIASAEGLLATAEQHRDTTQSALASARVSLDEAMQRDSERERAERAKANLDAAKARATAAADDAQTRLDAAHASFDEWGDDPDGERVRVALQRVTQAVSDARSAASAAHLSTAASEANEHADEAQQHLAYALEGLAEVAREVSLAERERAERLAHAREAEQRQAAEQQAELARIAAAQDAEAQAIRHAQVQAELAAQDLPDTAGIEAAQVDRDALDLALTQVQAATTGDDAATALADVKAAAQALRQAAARHAEQLQHANDMAQAQGYVDAAGQALDTAQQAAASVSEDAGDVTDDALRTALDRVTSALDLVRDAHQTTVDQARLAADSPGDSYHLNQASLAAARAEASSAALMSTVHAARDILRLGREAAQERQRATSAAERADEEASVAAAAQRALRDAQATLEQSTAGEAERALLSRLERARGRAEVVAERADAIVRHAEHAATGHPADAVRTAVEALREQAILLHEGVAIATRDIAPTEEHADQAEEAAAGARETLARVERAARGVHDAVRDSEAAETASAERTEQHVERARAAAETAELAVQALDHAIRADDVTAPGALDAFTNASRLAESAQRHAADASSATTSDDAERASAQAVQAAADAKEAVDAAHAAIAIEVGSRDHDNAALSRARASAQQAAYQARIHAQQASRIAMSVDDEADDDNEDVAAARTRVAELASAVRFAAERADFAQSEADETTDIAVALGAAQAAQSAAHEAESALLSLESADDDLASALTAGPLRPIAQRVASTAPVSATITPTPTRAERVDAAPGAPAPLPPPQPAPQSAPIAQATPAAPPPPPPEPPKKRRRWALTGVLGAMGVAALVLVVVGAGVGLWGYNHYSAELPTLEALQAYEPPTVTTVYDYEGELLGEIYEERRYVVPLEEMPEHVQHAFVSAEDKAFWDHGGVNWVGLVRATLVNFTTGEKSQGASTITMQVTRNFLLTRDKTYERKIKEIILAQRIEGVYDKEHILYLYLNELYLGSGAYGVEAAARAYFGKHVSELTIAEAAMIAGLAPAPSTYSPHRNFDKAQTRQRYVLGRMLDDGHITQSEYDDAIDEHVVIVERTNEFLEMAPYFTEHVRKYVVDTYGHDRVYNEGLSITTTCDLDLQRVAQAAVKKGVDEVDQRMGFRREGVENIGSAAIPARLETIETELIDAQMQAEDPAGRIDRPSASVLEPGTVYTGVLKEVQPRFARVGIGSHEAIIPLEWSKWVFDPNPALSWRRRSQTDLTEEVTWDLPTECPEDEPNCEPDTATGPILQVGDVILVKVESLSTQDEEVASAFRRTPGETEDRVAARLWQDNEVEAALMSYDLETGAVRSMIGGSDFESSEFNRTTQAYRQVGSTFKPIVYAAAIASERVTAATMVTDGPLAFSTSEDFIWKPGNYSNTYLGNMTLRKALAMSRNTCTIRVLDRIDPGMNDDIVYDFVRKLGIGGPPAHRLPEDWVPTPDTDHTCPWIREEADFTVCTDHFPTVTDDLTNTAHRAALTEDDEHFCRACDLSMGLGSRSLTMEELMRAYSTFATGGNMVEPYYIEEVRDRDGNVLERHAQEPHVQVLDPAVASITTWLMEGVVQGGTAGRAARLGLHLAGKTGTTNDEKDMWFIGFNPEVITAVWVGHDDPRSLGVSSTGGRTALPIWMEYMAIAVPPERDRPFEMRGRLEYAQIEEATGRRVTSGGRRYPFLEGTAPESTGIQAGQISIDDLQTEL